MGNKKTKNLIFLAIALITCFVFTGCSEINFTTYHNDDGSITEQVIISIDEQELASHGYNVLIEEQKIFADVNSRINKLILNYQSYLKSLYYTNKLTADYYKVLYNGVVGKMSPEWTNGNLTAQLDYADQTSYQFFYLYLRDGQVATGTEEVVKTIIYVKTIYTGTANYGDFALYSEVYDAYANSTFARFDAEATSLYYNYSASSKRIHSDADSIYLDENGNYIHRWKIDKDNPSRQIQLYIIQARPYSWILICIGISLTTCLISFIIVIVKQHKKSKQEEN